MDWDTAIDKGVYNASCGLRMLGSLKVKKGRVIGRPYRVVVVVDAAGCPLDPLALTAFAADEARVLDEVSIHPGAES